MVANGNVIIEIFPREYCMTKATTAVFYTTTEAAKRLGYTIQHVRLLIRQNRLQGVRMGRDWFITEDVLSKYAQRQTKNKIPGEVRI